MCRILNNKSLGFRDERAKTLGQDVEDDTVFYRDEIARVAHLLAPTATPWATR